MPKRTSKPVQRTCDQCGKPLGVTFYAVEVKGKIVSVAAHPKCINTYRVKHSLR